MEKILNLLGYKGKKNKWEDIPYILKLQIIKKLPIEAAMFIIAVVFVVLDFKIINLLVSLFVVLGYSIILYLIYLNFAYGNYNVITGKCIKVSKPTTKIKFISTETFGAASIFIKTYTNATVEVPISHQKNILPGYEVEVYVGNNNIFEKEPDLYKVLSPYAINIIHTDEADLNKE